MQDFGTSVVDLHSFIQTLQPEPNNNHGIKSRITNLLNLFFQFMHTPIVIKILILTPPPCIKNKMKTHLNNI